MNRSRWSNLLLAALVILWAGPPLSGQTPAADLIEAINKRDEPKAALLLKQGADPNVRDAVTQPAITAAAYFGLEKTVQALLASGADMRLLDSSLGTVSAGAAVQGDPASRRSGWPAPTASPPPCSLSTPPERSTGPTSPVAPATSTRLTSATSSGSSPASRRPGTSKSGSNSCANIPATRWTAGPCQPIDFLQERQLTKRHFGSTKGKERPWARWSCTPRCR
jgi:hypothetical protein